MSRLIQLILAISAAAVLAGCASTDTRTDTWMQLEQARQARLDVVAAQCQTDLCLVMVAQEAGKSTPVPQKQYHPAWSILGNFLNAAVPAYAGVLNTEAWGDVVSGVTGTIAGMDNRHTDNSITVGGNYGDTRGDETHVGGNQGDTNHGRIGSDGDDVGRDQIRNSGRWNSPGDDRDDSPGPIDESGDCRDSGDCSTPEPPDENGGG